MKALVTKRKARGRRRRRTFSAPQRQLTLARHGDSYKATGPVSVDGILMATTSTSTREQLRLEIVNNLRRVLGDRPLVEQAAAAIIAACKSDMLFGDRVLKVTYLLSLCGVSADVVPHITLRLIERFEDESSDIRRNGHVL